MERIKILIIEDDTLISMQLENLILNLGHDIAAAVTNSKDAIDISKENHIDLIVSDVNIEGEIDGIETSNSIYLQQKVPIIFITAYKDIQTLKKASGVKYEGYILKPFREDELETLINLTILKYDLPKRKSIVEIDKNYTYNKKDNKLFYKNNYIELTKSENKFIQLLLNSKNEFVTYELIEQILWEDKIVNNETRRQLIYRLKKKIPDFPFVLKKGIGYKIKTKI